MTMSVIVSTICLFVLTLAVSGSSPAANAAIRAEDCRNKTAAFCMFHPPGCSVEGGANSTKSANSTTIACVLAVRIAKRPDDPHTLHITQMARVRHDRTLLPFQYIALGFSQTRNKDYTSVTDCTVNKNGVTSAKDVDVHISYNHYDIGNKRINDPKKLNATMMNPSVMVRDGYIVCEYDRPMTVGMDPEHIFDLNDQIYYVFSVTAFSSEHELEGHGPQQDTNPYFPAISEEMVDFSKMKYYKMLNIGPMAPQSGAPATHARSHWATLLGVMCLAALVGRD